MSKKKLLIISLKDKLLPEFRIFIKNYWQKNHIFSRKNNVLKWYYFSKKLKKYNFYLAKYNLNIVGTQGFIPFRLFDNKLKYNHIFLAFWRVIKTDLIGLGYLIHKKIIKSNKPSFVGVIGINDELLKFHRWQGFTVKEMDHFVYISPYIKKFKILNLKNYKKKNSNKLKKYKILELNKPKLYKKIDSNLFKFQIPIKSKKYLINRYLKNPFYRYNIFLIFFDDKEQSIVVTRKINVKKTSIIKIIDYIGSNSNFKKLDFFMSSILKKNQSEFIDIYSYGISKNLLLASGFKEVKINSKIIVPNHFEPLENKNIKINCAYKILKGKNKVRIFRGDGDGDRPSII